MDVEIETEKKGFAINVTLIMLSVYYATGQRLNICQEGIRRLYPYAYAHVLLYILVSR